MLEGLGHLFAARPLVQVLVDLFDILIVTYVVYRALLVLRGTRAMQMGTGLGVIFLIYVVAKWAGLVTLFNLLSTLLSSIILIVVVVFQNDIRRGLMRVGSRAFFSGIARQQETRVIDEVVAAATELARHRMGALICFEQDANLDEFVVAQGTTLDSSVQRELLVSLFIPESLNKLHDGAVVIRNLRIAKAGVFFPMPDTKLVDKSLGSRHRAALGITEETDAVVVVVSEERGTISFCFNGNIVPNLDGASLKQALLGLFGQRARAKKKGTAAGKRNSMTNTGSFRITVPSGSPTSSPPGSRNSTVGREPDTVSGRLSSVGRESPEISIGRTGIIPPEESVPMGRLSEAGASRPMPSSTIETPIPMPSSNTPPRREGE
ncbi:Diadenylate cyclase spyDAC [Labilithrix luteola]|uniref:Diadenylate cyclase n=1 Tax=Labilithrix luteola TaxID=1391654 RepID=A0A0K1PX51_9BACT|nr:diadenylate cyclase CdaA [Labilithrix luteola]AKU98097.1 Diadenylate cyclase spyDAC [Labilithrix luteola]